MEALLPSRGGFSAAVDEGGPKVSRALASRYAAGGPAGAFRGWKDGAFAGQKEAEKTRLLRTRIGQDILDEDTFPRISSGEDRLRRSVSPSPARTSREKYYASFWSGDEESLGTGNRRRGHLRTPQDALQAELESFPEEQRHWGNAALHRRPLRRVAEADTSRAAATAGKSGGVIRAASEEARARDAGKGAAAGSRTFRGTAASDGSLRPAYSFAFATTAHDHEAAPRTTRAAGAGAIEEEQDEKREKAEEETAEGKGESRKEKDEPHLWIRERKEGIVSETASAGQKPISAARLLKLVESGIFNGRGKEVFYRRVDVTPPEKSRTLASVLPDVMREAALLLQQQIAPRQLKAAAEEEEKDEPMVEVVEEQPMEFGPSVSSTGSFSTLEQLRKNFGTCDLLVWLVPPAAAGDELQAPSPTAGAAQDQKFEQYLAAAFPRQRSSSSVATALPATTPLKIYKIPVHAALLRISSPVWLSDIAALEDKRRMRLRYQPPSERDAILNYELPTAYPEGVHFILQSIYGQRRVAEEADPFLLIQVYKEAWRWKMDRLCEEVLQQLARPMSIEFFATLAHAAEFMRERQLLRDCVRILADSAFAVFAGLHYLQLGPEGLRLLLQHDNLQMDEIQVFLCASAWLNDQSTYFWERDAASAAGEEKEEEDDVERAKQEEHEGGQKKKRTGRKTEVDAESGVSQHRADALAMDIFRCIRYDSMSASQIRACREPALESLLLDACLRKCSRTEWYPRVFPWTENAKFAADKNGGLFPVAIVRAESQRRSSHAAAGAASRLDDDGGFCSAAIVPPPVFSSAPADASRTWLPNPAESSSSPCSRWAWTVGGGRLVNEAFWAAEILRTARGALHFGVAIEDRTTRARLVCYFDCEARGFVTGTITRDPEIVAYRTLQSKGKISWSRRLFRGDVIVTRLSVVPDALHVTLEVLHSENLRASYTLPLRAPVVYPGNVLRRPFLTVWPFLEACDEGDAVGVPDIHTTTLQLT